MDAAAKTIAVREAILDIVVYFAVHDLTVSQDRLVQYLSVKANHLAVVEGVRDLVNERILQRVGDEYGLARQAYKSQQKKHSWQMDGLARADTLVRRLGRLPFVKAVLVVNEMALGNTSADTTVDLLVVTTPGRIFVAQAVIERLIKVGRLFPSQKNRIPIRVVMYLTVRGVVFERDIMRQPDPALKYWLLSAVPLYGAKRWAEILQASPFIRIEAPNMLYPRGGRTIDHWSWRWLDRWDDRHYRIELKRTSQNKASRDAKAFVRIRPDIINIQLNDRSETIAEQWQRLRSQAIKPRSPIKKKRSKSKA